MRAFFGAKCDDEILLEPGTFDKLIKHAEAMLQNESMKEQEHSQAIVAITSNGNVVGCVRENAFAPEISSERLFFKQLDDGHDTEIKKIGVMWSDGSIDMLSYDLRKKLCDLNEKNKNAEMLLPEMRGGYIIRTIVQTLSAQN